DKLAFGTVYQGATVEASFMLWEPGTDPNIKLDVAAPKFVKVLKKETEAVSFGPPYNFVAGSVYVSIDTSAAGDLRGEVGVTLGASTAKLPVSVSVKPRRAGLVRLLVPFSPWHRGSTRDGGLFKAWTDLVQGVPVDASYLLVDAGKPILRDLDLSRFDCVLLSGLALMCQTPRDVKRLRAFVEAGGRAVVAANRYCSGSVEKANELLTPYGLQMADEPTRDKEKEEVSLEWPDVDFALVKNGVKAARFHLPSPVAVTDPNAGRVLVKAFGVGQQGDGFVASAKAGKGEVVAIGESLPFAWM